MRNSFAGVDSNHILNVIFSKHFSHKLLPPPPIFPPINLLSVVSESLLLVEYFLLFFSLSICLGVRGQRRQKRKTTSEMMFTKFTSVNEITSWWHRSVRTSSGPPASINQLYLNQTSALWTQWNTCLVSSQTTGVLIRFDRYFILSVNSTDPSF